MQEPFFDIIPLYIYPCSIYISVNQTNEDLTEELLAKKVVREDIDELMNREDNEPGLTVHLKNGNIIIRFKHYDECSDDRYRRKTILHESFHATLFVMRFISAFLDDSSEEPYAYLQEYIFNEVCKKLEL